MKKETSKKSRAMAIAAIGAVAILLASTLVRCAVSSSPDAGIVEDVPAATQEQTEATDAQDGQQTQDGKEASTMDQLAARSWVAKSGNGATLQVAGSIVVERASDGTLAALTYTGAQEQDAGGQTLVTLTLEDGKQATLVVTSKDGSPQTVESDSFALAKAYVAKAGSSADSSSFEVTGLSDAYLDLVDNKSDGLKTALAAFSAKRAPAATKASFDGEVYLDLNDGLVSATFHLNDSASTIVSVSYQDGAFKAV